jgi:hypothetical protein
MNPAVHPGINRICLKLRLKPDNLSDLASPKGIQGTPQHRSDSKTPSPYAAIAFDESDMPPSGVFQPLLDVFFDSLAQHYPSIQRLRLQNRLADGTMSAFLLNGMLCIKAWNNILPPHIDVALCAISARFASPDKAYHANVSCLPDTSVFRAKSFPQAGDVFADKAMQLLVPALRLPTTDAVTSLLLLSQCEFGQNSESGYWVSRS